MNVRLFGTNTLNKSLPFYNISRNICYNEATGCPQRHPVAFDQLSGAVWARFQWNALKTLNGMTGPSGRKSKLTPPTAAY
jgi:hypothetical protein